MGTDVQDVRQSMVDTGSSAPTSHASRWAALAEPYARDGAVCIRQALDLNFVRAFRKPPIGYSSRPSRFGEAYGGEAGAASFRGDKFMWLRDPDFRALALAPTSRDRRCGHGLLARQSLLRPSAGEAAWQRRADQMAQRPELLAGRGTTDLLGLDRARSRWTASNGRVGFVRGSHLWPQRFQPMDFTRMRPVLDPDYQPVPDIDGNPGDYEILAWDLEPG